MNFRGRKLSTFLLVTCVASLSATALAAQPAAGHPLFPPGPEGCRVWDAHVTYVIEQHRRDGTSEAALGEALSKAYAMYAKCVMGGCDMNGVEAVAALDEIQLALVRGRAVALVEESNPGPR